jgi:hypothetical protein
MAENLEHREESEGTKTESEILTNDYGTTRDSAVVIEEETRTVLLTEDETIVIEKEPRIDIVPKNRPRRIYAGMWGSTEIATAGLGLLAVLTVIILVVLVVLPAQKELENNRAERNRLETELLSARGKYGDITDTETQVAKLITSVNDFEARFLPIAGNGRTALYQRINGLISAYGLVNTSGPEYTPLEISDERRGQTTETEQGRAKFQSLFPGVYVSATLEGSYQNLRRFIRDIETSEQFVVISAVELAPAENNDNGNTQNGAATQASINSVKVVPQMQVRPMQSQPDFNSPSSMQGIPNQGGASIQQPPFTQQQMQQTAVTTTTTKAVRGKTHGETVSLHLEMAAYFRRPNAVQTTLETLSIK